MSLDKLRNHACVFVDVTAEDNFRGFSLDPGAETPTALGCDSKVALYRVDTDEERVIKLRGIQSLIEAVAEGDVNETCSFFDGLLRHLFERRKLRLKSVELEPAHQGPCDPTLELSSKYLFVLRDKDMCKVYYTICRSIGRDRFVEIPAFEDAKSRHDWFHKLGGRKEVPQGSVRMGCYDTACSVTSVRGVLVVACNLQLISIC